MWTRAGEGADGPYASTKASQRRRGVPGAPAMGEEGRGAPVMEADPHDDGEVDRGDEEADRGGGEADRDGKGDRGDGEGDRGWGGGPR